MRAAPAALQAFLATRRPYHGADLFTITLADNSVYAWTSYDTDLRVGAYVYSAMGPLIDRTKWGIKNTMDVPEMEVKILTNGHDMPDGSNLKLLVHNGLFDYATVKLSRVFMPVPGDTSLGAVDLFLGDVAQVTIDALSLTLSIKGANNKLAQYMPRNQYLLSCNNSVFDAGCAPNPGAPGGGPLRSAYTVANTVGAGSTQQFIVWGSAPPANYANFASGVAIFGSGTSEGLSRVIVTPDATGFALSYPLYQVPEPGDTFTTSYGCARNRGANGCAFFNNLQNYRGFPLIPPAEFGI